MTYYCYEGSRYQINNEIFGRNLPNEIVYGKFDPRPAQTRYAKMPIFDCFKQSSVPLKKNRIYNSSHTYLPTKKAPFSGFADNVDIETLLRNSILPLQVAPRSKYIPSSKSELFQTKITNSRPVKMSHLKLFKEERFNYENKNKCKLGWKVFNNHTKNQIKNLDLISKN